MIDHGILCKLTALMHACVCVCAHALVLAIPWGEKMHSEIEVKLQP